MKLKKKNRIWMKPSKRVIRIKNIYIVKFLLVFLNLMCKKLSTSITHTYYKIRTCYFTCKFVCKYIVLFALSLNPENVYTNIEEIPDLIVFIVFK